MYYTSYRFPLAPQRPLIINPEKLTDGRNICLTRGESRLREGVASWIEKRPAASCLRRTTAVIGLGQLVYMKIAMHGDEQAFMIYAADGTLLEVADAVDEAMLSVVDNNVSCVSLH